MLLHNLMPVSSSHNENSYACLLVSFRFVLTSTQVSRLVRENLIKRAGKFNIALDDVSITHVAFSPEFTHAVEAKQVAQQTALRAAFLVEKAHQEKQVCPCPHTM